MRKKIAFFGVAHGHVHLYAQVLKTYDNIEIVGLYDHLESRLQKTSKKLGIPQYDSYKDLLSNDINLVIIGCETSMHLEAITILCNYNVDMI